MLSEQTPSQSSPKGATRKSACKSDRLDRLFELIRQQNLANKRRGQAERPLNVPRAQILARMAGDSLRPAQALAPGRAISL